MNLKQAFYKDYYQGIDFRKPQDDAIKRHNKDVFEKANRKLFKYAFKESEYQQLALSNFNLPNYDSFELSTTYPGLLTGVGMVHETNNEGELMLGFFFDHVSGLPMLPGSGVKGALRSAFPQFKTKSDNPIIPLLTAEMDKESYLDKQKAKAQFIASIFPPFSDLKEGDEKLYIKVHQLEMAIFQGMDILAKKENPKTDGQLPMAKRCRFLEAIIKDSANSGKKIVGIDALTPHGNNPLKNPVPLPFLKVLPNVVFQFQFMLPDLLIEGAEIKGTDLLELFKNILLYFVLGAKTNVGYGQFTDELPQSNPDRRGLTEPTTISEPIRNKPRWTEIIPRKVMTGLKKSAKLDGIIDRIEGDYAYIHFTINNETAEIRKKFNAVRNTENKKLTELTELIAKAEVWVKIQNDYNYGDERLACQIQLKN